MKRPVIVAMIKLCGEAVLITVLVGVAVVMLGNLNKWDTSMKYSNAFFIAGALVIIGGLSSRMAAGQEWHTYLRSGGEGFGHMSPTERANFIVEASSSLRLVIVALISGISLMIISLLVWEIF